MPITPFHLGPGALVKALAPRAVSFTAFAAANVVIDLESVFNLLTGRYPVHATLHTFVASLAVGIVVGAAVALVGRSAGSRVRRFGAELEGRPALLGGVLGGLSQPLLDAVMHADIRPFLPWTEANPLLRIVGLDVLHVLCLGTGAVGVAMLGWRRWRAAD